MKRIEITFLLTGTLVVILLLTYAYAQSMSNNYTNRDYGFVIWLPDDWEIKDGIASGTVVKAVYRDEFNRVAMITINVQRLATDAVQDFKNTSPERVAEVIRRNYGNSTMVLNCGSTYIDGEYAVWIKNRMKHSDVMDRLAVTYVIPHNNFLFTVSGLADAEIYPNMESLLEKSITSMGFGFGNKDLIPDVTESSESILVSFLKAWWKVFLMVILTSVFIGVVKFVIAKSKK